MSPGKASTVSLPRSDLVINPITLLVFPLCRAVLEKFATRRSFSLCPLCNESTPPGHKSLLVYVHLFEFSSSKMFRLLAALLGVSGLLVSGQRLPTDFDRESELFSVKGA